MNRQIPFAIPDIGEEEIAEVTRTMQSGLLTAGPMARQFENDFKNFIGSRHALAVNSATSGLHLALLVAGIGIGDYVIVPVNTYTATANVVCHLGATPLFCDIDPDTFTMDPVSVRKIFEFNKDKKIRAVIPVHIAGQAVDLKPIFELKKEFDFVIIEDAAHALPCTYQQKMIGTIGDLTVFSFYPTKTLASCEGGMICTDNDEWANRLKILKNSGINRDILERSTHQEMSWFYDVEELGYKYSMNDIAASIGIQQLKKAERFLKRRVEIANYYDEQFSICKNVQIPFIRNKEDIHSRHLYIIKTEGPDKMAKELFNEGIRTSVHFRPLHMHTYWKNRYNFKDEDFPVASKTYEQVLSLPIHTKLSDLDVERIALAIKKLT